MWIITDGRLGHLNQLRGLIERLQAKADIELHWLDLSVQPFRFTRTQGLLSQFHSQEKPDWVLSAGSKTHLPLLWCKWML